MAEIIRWHEQGSKADAAASLVKLLAAGQTIGLPTETEYVVAVAAQREDAVHGLAARLPATIALFVRHGAEACHWLGDVSTIGRRLMRRCWPGPIDLVFAAPTAGPLSALPAAVRETLAGQGRLSLSCPGHEVVHLIAQQLDAPLLLGTLAAPEAIGTAAALDAVAGNWLAALVDDGQTRYGRSTTAVRIDAAGWDIARPGLVPAELVERLACCLILFVCTGNTCRSPLAEALCKKLLADRLGCAPEKLPGLGFLVESAGLSAQRGAPAAAEAVLTAQEFGADLSEHRSQPVTPDLVIQADHVIAMTGGHLRLITDYFRELEAQPRLLCAEGQDVPDPIGCGLPVYQECARLIRDNVERFLSEIQPS